MKNNVLWILAIICGLASFYPIIDWITLDLTRVEIFQKWYALELFGTMGAIYFLSKLKP